MNRTQLVLKLLAYQYYSKLLNTNTDYVTHRDVIT